MVTSIAEFHIEEATIAWFQELGYTWLYGPDNAFGELPSGRKGWTKHE